MIRECFCEAGSWKLYILLGWLFMWAFILFWYQGSNSRAHACKAGTYVTEQIPVPSLSVLKVVGMLLSTFQDLNSISEDCVRCYICKDIKTHPSKTILWVKWTFKQFYSFEVNVVIDVLEHFWN